MKLIDLYEKWIRTGRLNANGLCNSLPYKYKRRLKFFYPLPDEWKERSAWSNEPSGYWAYDGETDFMINRPFTSKEFSPLRQTIVLFICAMHDEL